ncbi:MAG: hypothetical protein HZB17_09025, partial [Chloroflexi bacterium]|nr:hypothetical protein [Chloroflexota bacterium]
MRLRAYSLTLALLLLLVSVPILRDGTPTIVDGEIHFFRAAALSWHLQHGDLYPRWFSDMHFGYGAPVFNFYSPLSYYVPAILNVIGLSLPGAMQISYILCFALAIFGAYYWARDQFESSLAGIVTTAAYSLSPFFNYNVLHRGALPETFALGLTPCVFWAALRLACDGTRRTQLIFVTFYALLILSHNITALLILPALWIYLAALTFKSGRHSALFAILYSSFFIFIAIALCAFYLLPVYFENSYIQLWRAYSTFELDYHSQFLTLTSLFAPPFTFDHLLVYNRPPISLGWFQSIFAIIAIVYVIIQHLKNKFSFIIITSALILMLFMFFTLSISTPLWDLSPLSRPIQFPSRLVGPASLFLAVLAGYGAVIAARLTRRSETLIANVAIASFFFFSLPWAYHNVFKSLPDTVRPENIIHYEIASSQIATTTMGEFLPIWVTEVPKPDSLLARYAADSIPSRLATLPEGVTCQVSNVKLNEEEVRCESPKDFNLTFNRFYFPSWAAALDNKPVGITPSQPQGLITLNIPSGSHTIKVFLQPTTPQIVGGLISLLSLALLFAIRYPSLSTNQSSVISLPTSNVQPLLCSLFIVALFIIRVVYLDRYETIFHRTALHSLPNSTSSNFGNQLNLIGFEYSPSAASGDTLDVHLYWQIIPSVNINYSTSIQLVDRFGNRFGQSDNQNIAGVGTSVWSPEKYGRDTHQIKSFSGTPPGEYRLLVGVHHNNKPLNIMRDGSPTDVEYEIGKVNIRRNPAQPKGELRLVEASVARRDLFVGDSFAFTTLWHSGDTPTDGVTATVSFTDSQNKLVSVKDFALSGIDYTPDKWNRNELIVYPQAVIVPPDLAAGTYRVGITLNNGA